MLVIEEHAKSPVPDTPVATDLLSLLCLSLDPRSAYLSLPAFLL